MGEILRYESDGVDDKGTNDINTTAAEQGIVNDGNIRGSPRLQEHIRALIAEYSDIFSASVKGRAMDVPPMTFTVDNA
jgi:hypothetical protein